MVMLLSHVSIYNENVCTYNTCLNCHLIINVIYINIEVGIKAKTCIALRHYRDTAIIAPFSFCGVMCYIVICPAL